MSISMFDTRVMTQALDKMSAVRPKTFLRDTFYRNVRTFDTEKVDVDVRKGKRKIAAYVSRRAQANVVTEPGFRTDTYTPPFVAETIPTDAENIFKRGMGEGVYSTMSAQERAAARQREHMMILDDRLTRLEEYQAMEGLINGKVVALNGDEIDFQRDSNHNITLTSGARWNQNGSTPIFDVKDWRNLAVKDSGLAPDITIMGTEAFKTFLANSQVKDLLNNLRINIGAINQQNQMNGVTYYGELPDFGSLYTYDEYYWNGSVNVALIPSKKVIMASRSARFDRLYGALSLANEDTKQLEVYAVERLVDSFVTKNPDARFIRMQSAPLLVPVDIDSVVVAQVID